MALIEVRFGLELHDGDGLVHLCGEDPLSLVDVLCSAVEPWLELLAGVVLVGVHGESGEGHEVDAVSLFERCEVGVSEREPDDVADAGVVSGAGPHP